MPQKNQNEPEKSPKKPPRKTSTRRSPKKSTDNKQKKEPLNNQEVQDAFNRLIKEEITAKRKTINNIKSLESLLNQYLNSFILIGYSQDKKEFVSLVNAKNEQQSDSLSAALNKFILNNSNNSRQLPPFM